MGWWRAAITQLKSMAGLSPPAAASGWQFATSGPIDALIRGVWGNTWLTGGPVSRDDAMSVGAVERGRDVLCSIAVLPLVNYRGLDRVPNSFLDQPDPDVPRVVMFAQTIEDLLCESVAWWIVTAKDYRGFPLSARRVDPGTVSLTPPSKGTLAPLPSGNDPRGASVWVNGHEVPAAWVIRFDSPGRPLLSTGHRTIRRALLLDALAAMYAENPRPLEAFSDTDDQTVVPYSDTEVEQFLAEYMMARKRGGPAYIPRQMTRSDVSAPSPAELQLVELQREVSLELALHMGLDPEDVGVNTTSRTYFNSQDRRTDKINHTFAPYMSAISDRLSMRDVTPAGQRVRWDLADYLRPDPASQISYWEGLQRMGIVSDDWIAGQAGISGADRGAATPRPALPVAPAGGTQHSLPAGTAPARLALAAAATFDAAPAGALRFSVSDFAGAQTYAAADVEKRTITGLAVPFNARAEKYGVGFRFLPGSLEYDQDNPGRLRVMDGHTTYIGVHKSVEMSKAGPTVTLKVLEGVPGSQQQLHRDQVLMDAAGGLADGLSVGVDFSLDPEDGDVVWDEATSTYNVVRATWLETSVTPDPAFTGARVTRVAASKTGGTVQCQFCGQSHPAGMACATFAQLHPAPPAAAMTPTTIPGQLVTAGAPAGQQFAQVGQQAAAALPTGPTSAEALTAALTAHVQTLVQNGVVADNAQAAGAGAQFAQTVNPLALGAPGANGTAQQFGPARVTEPEPYHLSFDRKGNGVLGRGTHDLSTDYHAWFDGGDKAAHDRALSFVQRRMAHLFNVATTDVPDLNPTQIRPDMYVDQRDYRSPIWDTINKGALSDITPFKFPKYNTSSGLVAAHTQGTEPSTGVFTVTGQTVSPTAYSGKARINREVWDQGGNPQVSTLIWNQMVRGVSEALEAAAVTELNAGSFTALGTFTLGVADRKATGLQLGIELESAIALLQFVRGGYRFSDAFAQADLYQALANARTTTGEPVYPMLGPANRNGQSAPRFGSIVVAGQEFMPAWALAAAGQTVAVKSYLIDRTAVHGWASAPQRLTMDSIAVAYVDLGVWGYQATAVSDTAGVRTITWDPI